MQTEPQMPQIQMKITSINRIIEYHTQMIGQNTTVCRAEGNIYMHMDVNITHTP